LRAAGERHSDHHRDGMSASLGSYEGEAKDKGKKADYKRTNA
jgi:hypothetical protein